MRKNFKAIILFLITAVVLLISSRFVFLQFNKETKSRKNRIVVATWAMWIPTEVIREFETIYDCEVSLEYYASAEECLSKIEIMGSSTNVDVIILSRNIVDSLYDIKILKPLDINRLNIRDKHMNSLLYYKDKPYAISYSVSNSKILYNIDVANKIGVKESEIRSINFFKDKRSKGIVNIVNDGREIVSYALAACGKDFNNFTLSDLNDARALMKEWRKNIYIVTGSVSDVIKGDLLMSLDDLHSIKEIENHSNVKVTEFIDIPPIQFSNDIMITSKNEDITDLIYDFINFITQTSNADKLCDSTCEKSIFASGENYRNIDAKNCISFISRDMLKKTMDLWVMFKFGSI